MKGAFTGATADRAGAFERADGGTLFLDEVGDLPLDIQPRLLRFFERREVKRIGSNDYKTVDVRVIAATHRDLASDVKAGHFREDLYHRISVVTVQIPPLRDRLEDIPLLIDALLEKLGKPKSELSGETRALFAAHGWPGNVRELRNVVERVVHLGTTEALDQSSGAPQSQRQTASTPAPGTGALTFKEAKNRLLQAFERDYLAALLERCDGRILQAAREAGLDRVHLYRLIRKYGLHLKE
jgi:DNA-binding NtrC family response regulator